MKNHKRPISTLRKHGAEILDALREANRHVRAISPKLWRWQFAGALFSALSGIASVLGVSFGYQKLIEAAASGGSFQPTWAVSLLALGLFVALSASYKIVNIVKDLNRGRFERLERLYLTRLRIAKIGRLCLGSILSPDFTRLSRWRERYGESSLVNLWKSQFDVVADIARSIGGSAIVLAVDPWVAAFAFAPGITNAFRSWRRRQRTLRLRRQGYRDRRVRDMFERMFSSAESVFALRLRGRDRPWASSRYDRAAEAANGYEDTEDRLEARDDCWLLALESLLFVAIGTYVSWLAVTGQASIAALIAMAYAFRTATGSISQLISAPARLVYKARDFRFFLAFERAEPIIREPDKPEEPAAGPIGVEARDLDFRYPASLPGVDDDLLVEMGIDPVAERPLVLRGLSLSIEPGERVAVVGANGSGKSTFLSLLARQYLPSSGALLLNGTLSSRIRGTWFPERTVFLPQRSSLPELPIDEAVTLEDAAKIDRERLTRAATLCGADDVVGKLGDGWSALHGAEEGGVELSGGQRQRLTLCGAIYRGLLDEVGLVALDEPTSQMDAAARDRFFHGVTDLARDRGKTLLIATHDFGWLHLFDRTLVVKDGRISDNLTAEDVRAMSADTLTARLMR